MVLAGTTRDDLLADVKRFIESRKWYEDRGLPYRRGYLLYGYPGTGKTSVTMALASHFNLPIYILNLNSIKRDETLAKMIGHLPKDSILLMEDVDVVVPSREKAKDDISLSALLNAIDGIGAGDGRILVLTTNHIEKLDPALLRPGRVDTKVFFDLFGPDEAKVLFDLFYGATGFADDFAAAMQGKKLSPAALQGIFMINRDNPRGAIASVALNKAQDLEKEAILPTITTAVEKDGEDD